MHHEPTVGERERERGGHLPDSPSLHLSSIILPSTTIHPSAELVTNFEYTTAANYPVIVAASSAAAAAALSSEGRPTDRDRRQSATDIGRPTWTGLDVT